MVNHATRDARIAMLAEQIAEYADAVQVLATYTDAAGQTHCVKTGTGNWYARTGMAREFLTEDQAQAEAYATAECDDEEDDL